MSSENGHAQGSDGDQPRFGGLALVPSTETQFKAKDFKSDQEVRWCPGCGDYAILAAFQSFLPELGVPRENIVIVSGIGCSSRFPYYLSTYGMHSIHGRAPAIATGLAASRPDLSVWVITGDGDGLSIGGNHLIHALRRNVNVNILLFNNRIYGLTKGQYSPTSEPGMVTKSSPMGSLDTPFNPVSLALGAEASFVARTVDSDRKHLTSVLRAAADHPGASFVEIYQNCPIFNDDAFQPLKDSAERDVRLLRMEHGEPLTIGEDRGVVLGEYGELSMEDLSTVGAERVVRHDAHRDSSDYAFALSRLDYPAFQHVPIGVFRDVQRPTYDGEMNRQVDAAVDQRGAGDLAGLLGSGDTWTVGD